MKNKLIKTLSLSLLIIVLASCTKETNNLNKEKVSKLSNNSEILFEAYYKNKESEQKILAHKGTEIISWYPQINENDKFHEIEFDYTSMPDVYVIEATDENLVLLIDEKMLKYDISLDENHIDFKIKTVDNEISELKIFSNTYTPIEIIDFFKNNEKISFSLKVANPWAVAAIIVSVGVWAAERYCEAKINNERIECISRGKNFHFVQSICGGTCYYRSN